jgi:hypothetical protein
VALSVAPSLAPSLAVSVARLIEPVFVMRTSQHERLFDVKHFVERVFAFGSTTR